MDWNIIFFEIALVSLLMPVGISLIVVLSSIKGSLGTVTKSLEGIGKALTAAALQEKELEFRFDKLEQRLTDKGHL